MSAKRIESELEVVQAKIAALRSKIASLEKWEGDLRTSLHVLNRLSGEAPPDPVVGAISYVTREKRINDTTGEVRQRTTRRGPPLATGKALEAGEAVISMLRAAQHHIRPLEVVRRLKEEHGIQIGMGKPGRETSDLSAALGHGRVPGLTVTRGLGWGLEEWRASSETQSIQPSQPEEVDTLDHDKDDPSDHDLANDEIALDKGAAADDRL